MAWRVLATDGEVWHVRAAAERRASANMWQLMLSFRSVDENSDQRAFWAPYPLEAASKSSLFVQADRISDDELHRVLVKHVG
jgi:hypothetical protein